MVEDDKAPTLEQRIQMQAGQLSALSAAVHALIRTHPDAPAFSAEFDRLLAVTDSILATPLAHRMNDGLSEAHAETARSLRSMLPAG